MNMHGPSLALGFSGALAVALAARRLRPVAIELGAVAIEVAKMGRAALEIQRENLEDFFCDIEVRVTERAKTRRQERGETNDRETHPPSSTP
jgi:hypothetical protein